MKGTALTALLPNLIGFTSPRGLNSSRVQTPASRASHQGGFGAPEHEGARRQSAPPGAPGYAAPAAPCQLEPHPPPPPQEDDPPQDEEDPQDDEDPQDEPLEHEPEEPPPPAHHDEPEPEPEPESEPVQLRITFFTRNTKTAMTPTTNSRPKPDMVLNPPPSPRSPESGQFPFTGRGPRERGMPAGHPGQSTLEQVQRFPAGWRP